MRVALLLSFLIAAAPAAAAVSDAKRSGLAIGARGAYLEPNNVNRGGDGDFYGGMQLRLGLGEVIALEGSADYRQTEFRNRTIDVFPVQASVLAFVLPGKPISPFVLAGAGWYYSHVRDGNTDNRFGPHAGAGVEFFFHENWSLDATYRYVWIDDIDSVGDVPDANFDDEGHMATIGLNYHF